MLSALRPQAVKAVILTRAARYFSYGKTLKRGQFTIAIPDALVSKNDFLRELVKKNDAPFQSPPHCHDKDSVNEGPDNAVVILASPALSWCVDDKAFMSQFLHRLPSFQPRIDSSTRVDVSVLCAVVDGLGSLIVPEATSGCKELLRRGRLKEGISVLHGNLQDILPGLWQQRGDDRKEEAFPRGMMLSGNNINNTDAEAALTVELAPLAAEREQGMLPSESLLLQVTVPLANTVFQNGRRSTLLASKWKWSGSEYVHICTEAKAHQTVRLRPPRDSLSLGVEHESRASVPLLAVTEPHRIVASLGNIVRQIELNGKAAPASQELEAIIPPLFAARQRRSPALATEALGVWALVIPTNALPIYDRFREALAAVKGHGLQAERRAFTKTAPKFTELLAAGCRLHKVLSGGGGWGKKQGLLSLDPEILHPLAPVNNKGFMSENGPESDAAMDSFIRSFSGDLTSQDSVAAAGNYVQFFVSPSPVSQPSSRNTDLSSCEAAEATVVFGTLPSHNNGSWAQHGQMGEDSDLLPDGQQVMLIQGWFGAVSAGGIFLTTVLKSDSSPSHTTAAPLIQTRLNTPWSCVWESIRQ